MPDLKLNAVGVVSRAQVVDIRADSLTEAMVLATQFVAAHDNGVTTVLAMRFDYYSEADADGNSPVIITIIYQDCQLPCCEGSQP